MGKHRYGEGLAEVQNSLKFGAAVRPAADT
jgi:hypothetical protein